MFNIQNFKGELDKKGTLPTSRFYVEIPIPNVLRGVQATHKTSPIQFNTSFENDLRFRAESVRAPGVTMRFSNINRYGTGPVQKFPYNANFTDMAITFIADRKSEVWIFFYSWLNNIFSYNNMEDTVDAESLRYRTNYMTDYAVNLKIHVYDVAAKNSVSIQLIDAYPISMNDIALSWSDTNQLMKITVTFAFRHWLMDELELPENSATVNSPISLIIPPRAETIASAIAKSINSISNAIKSIK